MTISELFEKMKTATDEQNDKALEVFNEIMLAVKRAYPLPYKRYSEKLDEIYSEHEHLTKEEAMEYVDLMRNKDGSVGPHWTFEQVNSYMKSHNEYANLDPYSFYVALNMMYSDYYSPNKTTDTYAMLAKDFLVDKDAPKDKLKRYFIAMHS